MKKQILRKDMCCMAPGMRGLSMVELMVAMTIGLILTASIGYVYLGSRQTFRSMDDFSRIQENYRYAMDQIGMDVRQAGYSGCVNVSSIDPANPANIPLKPVATHPLGQALRGYTSNVGWAAPLNYVAGTDVLQVTAAMGQGVNLSKTMADVGEPIEINGNPAGIEAGDILLIVTANCTFAEVFTADEVDATPSIKHAGLTDKFSTAAEIYPLVDSFYYIGSNPAGNRSLYRIQNGGAAEELVENVEDMVLRFGVDTNNDFAIDSYVDAAGVANWRQVLSARVNLVFLSNNNVATGAQPYVVEGVATTPGDTRLRQVATATYGLRNRLP
jgi:type IV pilus assembly protein PilW